MVGLALEIQPPAAVRPDPFGQADGRAQRGEGPALLDVQLDDGADAVQQVIARAQGAGIVARGRHGLGQRGAGIVGQRPRRVGADGAGQQAGAETRDAEPAAFFLGEGGQHHGPSGMKGFRLQQVDGGQRGDHAERAVEAAAVGDRIQVAAGHDGGRALRAPPGPQVAVVIGLDGQAALLGLRW